MYTDSKLKMIKIGAIFGLPDVSDSKLFTIFFKVTKFFSV